MFPLHDNIPSSRTPVVTRSIVVINLIAFLYQLSMGPRLQAFVFEYGISPVKLSLFGEYAGLTFNNTFMPFLYAQFLHGGWMHLIGNMWYLWIFGDNIEDRLGPGKFLFFYLTCGVVSMGIHCIFNPGSMLPAIGASGAIAGVLGAYMVTYPHARILTLVPILFFIQLIEIPALIVLGFWFVIQLLNGLVSSAHAQAAAGVAWWAHIGGFVTGIFLINRLSGTGFSRSGHGRRGFKSFFN